MPLDSSVQAEYQDGFILDETELNDINPYGEGNVFRAILNKSPETEHGEMIRFSVFWKDNRYDVDWTTVPGDARPIRFRHGYHTQYPDGSVETGFSGVDFGWQGTVDGKSHKEIMNL